jgi:hypothetical protein
VTHHQQVIEIKSRLLCQEGAIKSRFICHKGVKSWINRHLPQQGVVDSCLALMLEGPPPLEDRHLPLQVAHLVTHHQKGISSKSQFRHLPQSARVLTIKFGVWKLK